MPDALYRVGTSDYLQTLGVRLVDGRLIDDRDGPAPRVVVINETMAREFLPHESPLGHRIQMRGPSSPFHTIIGVVRDVRERGYEASAKPGIYLSIAQTPEAWQAPQYLVMRVTGDLGDLPESARRVIATVNPEQPITAVVRPMDEILDLQVADRHQQTILLGAFGALWPSCWRQLGLYGLLA